VPLSGDVIRRTKSVGLAEKVDGPAGAYVTTMMPCAPAMTLLLNAPLRPPPPPYRPPVPPDEGAPLLNVQPPPPPPPEPCEASHSVPGPPAPPKLLPS
jgi:hypothetical protein